MYKIVNSNGTKLVDLSDLSTSLAVNCEVYFQENSNEKLIGFVSHKTLVFFAVEFAEYALQNYTKKNIPVVKACIDLTRKWIEDQSSVSIEQLRDAANAANAAAAAAYAADAAFYAAAAAAYAADAAFYAAYAYAVNAAVNAANAANNKQKEKIRQGNFIVEFLSNNKSLFLL